MDQFVRRTCESFQYSLLWLLCRVRPGMLFYKAVPYVLALSAFIQIGFLTVSYGGVLLLIGNQRLSIILGLMFITISTHIFCRSERFALGVTVLLLFTSLTMPTRLWLSAANLLYWFAFRFERRLVAAQFRFKPLFANNVNQGSASVLRDKVDAIHIFAYDQIEWEEQAACEAAMAAKRSLQWLVRQATVRQVPLSFTEHVLWTPYNIPVPQYASPNSDHEAFANRLSEVVSEDLKDFQSVASRNCFVLVHTNQRLDDCLAYALPRRFLSGPQHPLEYAVIATPQSEYVYAHEILHLFGADDLYMEAYDRQEEQLRRELLHRSIMFVSSEAGIVDDLTAQTVGWM